MKANKNHTQKIIEILSKKRNENIISRESYYIEFKSSFNFSSLTGYAKTMAAFSNNSGGHIIFGINDTPRKPIGVDPNKFDEIKQEKITEFLLSLFEPEIIWELGLLEFDNKHFGFIFTKEADSKPIICKKNQEELKEGAIYYRYRAQDKVIKFTELKKIIDNQIRKINAEWQNTLKSIVTKGPTNIVILDKLKPKPSEIKSSFQLNNEGLPVVVDEKDIKKFYPKSYDELINELKNRYNDFKLNSNFHSIRKQLLDNKKFVHKRYLDLGNPKSSVKIYYSENIFIEFDKYYKRKITP